MIEHKINVNTRIIRKENVVPGPGKWRYGIGCMCDPEINVVAVGIKIKRRPDGASDAPGIIHVKALWAVAVSVGLVDQFLIRKGRPANAIDAPVSRQPV